MLSHDLSQLEWPASDQGRLAQRILPAYLQSGPSRFVANADVVIRLWRAGDEIVPLTVRGPAPATATAGVCSPWNHYVRYPLGEIARHRSGIDAGMRRALIAIGAAALTVSRVERVVSVNNWLLTTNPPVRLSSGEIDRMTSALCAAFADRAILVRTVNPSLDPGLAQRLAACGYRMVANRTVYLLDLESPACRRSKEIRRDRHLLTRADYARVTHDELRPEDMPRLAELHRMLYIEKHTALNPQFTPAFFETAWTNRFLEFEAFRRADRIDAYVAWYELGGFMTAALIGYDTSLPASLGLYRRGMAVFAAHARQRRLIVNLSAGSGRFKYLRGARPVVEYDAVYDRHLPRYRRAGWAVLQAAGWWQRRKVERGDL